MADTKSIVLKDGTAVELRTFVTARQARAFRAILIQGVKMDSGADPSELKVNAVSAEAISNEEDAEIIAVVVKLGGDDLNLLDRVLNLRKDLYDELMVQVKDVVSGKDFLVQSSASA